MSAKVRIIGADPKLDAIKAEPVPPSKTELRKMATALLNNAKPRRKKRPDTYEAISGARREQRVAAEEKAESGRWDQINEVADRAGRKRQRTVYDRASGQLVTKRLTAAERDAATLDALDVGRLETEHREGGRGSGDSGAPGKRHTRTGHEHSPETETTTPYDNLIFLRLEPNDDEKNFAALLFGQEARSRVEIVDGSTADADAEAIIRDVLHVLNSPPKSPSERRAFQHAAEWVLGTHSRPLPSVRLSFLLACQRAEIPPDFVATLAVCFYWGSEQEAERHREAERCRAIEDRARNRLHPTPLPAPTESPSLVPAHRVAEAEGQDIVGFTTAEPDDLEDAA